MNYTFKLRGNKYNLQNFQVFQTAKSHSLKYGLDAIPDRASESWQQVSIGIRVSASLALFKNCIKAKKCEDFSSKSCKIFTQNVGYI